MVGIHSGVSEGYAPAWHLSGPSPYAVQLEALRKSKLHDRFGYFLEQGLGKTALQLNDYIENYSDLDTVIVLCPNSFKRDWTLAPAEWGVPQIKGGYWPEDEMIAGSSRAPQFNVMNFEAVRGSGHEPLARLMDRRPCLLVVDESSAIKNFKSDTARAVLDLSKRAKAVRLLNGTPMSQNVMDLYPQLKCLGELDRVNPYAFRNRYAVLGGYMGKQILGVKNEEELRVILDRCSFRALKKDWSDLPPKIYTQLKLEMTSRQRKLYKEMLRDFLTMVSGHEYRADMVLAQMDKLRQITSGLLLDGDKHVYIEKAENNPKIRAAQDILESVPGKMIIVHFYSKMGDLIREYFARKGYGVTFIKGGMKPDEIIEQKRRFNDDGDYKLMVAQITAASRAHTLIGGEGDNRAHRMFFHDNTFSLLDRSQMEDRFHRGAQDKDCLYYDPVMSPIDAAQLKALKSKADIASAVVDAVRAMKRSGI